MNDAFVPSVEWDGFETDSFDALGAHPGLPRTSPRWCPPSPRAQRRRSTSGPVVTFTEAVTAAAGAFTLTCTTSGSVPVDGRGEQRGPHLHARPRVIPRRRRELHGDGHGVPVTDDDTNDPPDAMTADRTFTFTVDDLCAVAPTAIPVIQGAGGTPRTTGVRTVRGVVVGDYEGSAGLRGFYLQQQVGDGNPATSDAIFVFDGGGTDDVALGDVVAVRGPVSEFEGQTQISTSGDLAVCGTDATVPVTEVELPMASATAFERYEGMLVRMPQTLSVTEHFQLGRFGEVLVSSDGRLQQPTNILRPGPEAAALQDGQQPQPDPHRRRVEPAEPGPDRLRPGRRPAEREQHVAGR